MVRVEARTARFLPGQSGMPRRESGSGSVPCRLGLSFGLQRNRIHSFLQAFRKTGQICPFRGHGRARGTRVPTPFRKMRTPHLAAIRTSHDLKNDLFGH